MNLFDHTEGCRHVAGVRDATLDEAEAYMAWLAKSAGLPSDGCKLMSAGYDKGTPIIRGASFGDNLADGGFCIAMPGYGQSSAVIMETLDEAGEVIRSSVIGCKPNGSLGLDKAAVRAIAGKVAKPRKPYTRKTPQEATASAQEPVLATSVAPEPAIALPAPVPGDILARLARLEATVGIVERLKRTEAHAAAIRRAWAMRQAMRERADLDRRALLYANGVNASLKEQLSDIRGQLVAVETARAAAVHRAACDEARAIDAETAVIIMTKERDDALTLAAEMETRAIGADRAATALRRDFHALEARADRLARIAVSHRRDVRHAREDVRRAQLDVVMIRKSERQAVKRLDEMRAAIDASPIVAKIIDRATSNERIAA